jgi:hypothetical protein
MNKSEFPTFVFFSFARPEDLEVPFAFLFVACFRFELAREE